MERRRKDEVDRFTVEAIDGSERRFTILVLQTVIEVTTQSGFHEVPGLKELVTTNGYHANDLGNGVFEIPALALKARRLTR